jgi:two-component system, cell cycle response regulator
MGARVLTIEDTPHNLELMTYLLEAGGHTVVPATNGTEGIESARSSPPDLILLDIQLPDIDGYEVLSVLRTDPGLADVPIVAVTAYAMLGDREKKLAAGFSGYLSKPIDPETFVARIEGYLAPELRGTPLTLSWTHDDSPPVEVPSAGPHAARQVLAARFGAVNLAVARSTLEPHGYRVVAVDTAVQARAEAVADRPDLVLVELDALDDGTDVLTALRRLDELTDVPFAVLAASDATRHLPEPDIAVIRCPIDPEVLLARLDELTDSRRG